MSGSGAILFSDVDGTLLDQDGRYAMTAAELSTFLQQLSIVLTSSRTVLELSRNQRALGIEGPVVAENGAVIAMPWDSASGCPGARELIDDREWCVRRLGASAAAIREVVRASGAALHVSFVDQVDIEPTLGRECSVLLRPTSGSAFASLEPLAGALIAQGYSVASGGSWLAVTHGADKGTGALALLDALRASGHNDSGIGAVGDSDNDVPLFAVAPQRFVIRRPDGSWHPELLSLSGVTRLLPHGIAGWRDAVVTMAAAQDT